MHRLTPQFILDQLSQGIVNGRFAGVALFVDVSGFTAVTETLMKHGQHGAEELATVMRAIFSPLLQEVYDHGGWVVGFAGDAFTAVFPHTPPPHAPQRALAAGWRMQQRMIYLAEQSTEYGRFHFSIKIGVEQGQLDWGIISAENGQRAAFYCRGSAIAGCSTAEHAADRGDLIAGPSVWPELGPYATGVVKNGHWRVTAVDEDQLPAPQPYPPPPANVALMSRFFPQSLIEARISGEFRHIFNVFINLQGDPDPARLTRFMQTLFDLQDQYGGLLNRIDFGDKGCHLLLFWGAPISHENDAERVLNFILSLQEQSPFPLRAGITYQIAHAGFIGSTRREEYTCYGRGVNLAARLMTNAPWGQNWADEPVTERAEKRFDFDFVDQLSFKGFATPQPVFQLLGQQMEPDQPFYQGEVVGREAELAALNRFTRPLTNGRFAGVTLITGEAGIGKSRLLHEFLETSTILDTAELFLCQTDQIMRQSLNPFRYWLRDYFDQSPTQAEAVNQACFTAILDGLIAETADIDLQEALERGRSFLAALINLHEPDSLYEQVDTRLRFENSLDALKNLLKAESRRQPILLLIEDGHWLDGDSKQFLTRLTRNIDEFPIALLITCRRPLPDTLWPSDVPVQTIPLAPLDADGLTDLVHHLLGVAPDPELRSFLQQRTDGNPYFVEQLLIYLKDQGWLKNGRLSPQVTQSSSLIPRNTQTLLVARLDRLPPPVQQIVQMAAVLGREFDTRLLGEMMPNTSIAPLLESAAAESIWTAVHPPRYLFRHALMRDAAYEMQVRSRLRTLHHRAATAYETVYEAELTANFGQIAYHYDRAQLVQKALTYYEKAAEQTQHSFQNEESLAHYNRALALAAAEDASLRYRLLLGREAVLSWLSRREPQAETLAQLNQLLTRFPDPDRAAEVALRHAVLALATGAYETAVSAAEQSAQHALTAQNAVAAARAYHRHGRILWQQGRHQAGQPYLERAYTLARQNQADELEAQALYDLAIIHYYQNDEATALTQLTAAQTKYQQLSNRRGEISCLNLFGLVHKKLGNYGEARHQFEQSLTICRQVGFRAGEARNLSHIGDNAFELGSYETARTFIEQALTLYRESGDRMSEAVSLDTLGLIWLDMGQPIPAQSHFEEALALHQAISNPRGQGYALTHLGYSLAAQGRWQTAVSPFQQALTIRRQMNAHSLAIDAVAGLARCAASQHHVDQATAYVREIMEWIAEHGTVGIELPVKVYLICYQVMAPLDAAQARQILHDGHALLQTRAARIQDADQRQIYLQQVPYNRLLRQLWQMENRQ